MHDEVKSLIITFKKADALYRFAALQRIKTN